MDDSMAERFHIAEWYGYPFLDLTDAQRVAFAQHRVGRHTMKKTEIERLAKLEDKALMPSGLTVKEQARLTCVVTDVVTDVKHRRDDEDKAHVGRNHEWQGPGNRDPHAPSFPWQADEVHSRWKMVRAGKRVGAPLMSVLLGESQVVTPDRSGPRPAPSAPVSTLSPGQYWSRPGTQIASCRGTVTGACRPRAGTPITLLTAPPRTA